MDILAVQQRFIDAGYQFQEHIFNGGGTHNCIIKIAKSTDPHILTHGNNQTGNFCVGRCPRMNAWRQAAEWLDKQEAGE